MKYIEYYQSCMETGKLLNSNGLCYDIGSEALEVFEPTVEDCKLYEINAYWGSGYNLYDWKDPELRLKTISDFTPLRQTIILFLAAINEEL